MPVVIGRAVHLHPVVTIFAVLIGLEVYGVLGGLLGVPAAAAINVVFTHALPARRPGRRRAERRRCRSDGRSAAREPPPPEEVPRVAGAAPARRCPERPATPAPGARDRRPRRRTSRPGRPTDVALAAGPTRSRGATARLILILGALSAFAPLVDRHVPAGPAGAGGRPPRLGVRDPADAHRLLRRPRARADRGRSAERRLRPPAAAPRRARRVRRGLAAVRRLPERRHARRPARRPGRRRGGRDRHLAGGRARPLRAAPSSPGSTR